eukprot:TRINITY_DN3650_c0_g1_i1.p1 TRINITY_DN3650_c0_g1~~TRINITY_DN3650_c0_g1_i1.p1  ORF type:complete len:323 (+),score=95.45 TRINITY_DN3650_c0_g1_i1:43-1011(+)
MVNFSSVAELGLVIGTHVASSRVFTRNVVRKLYGKEHLDDDEIQTKRALLCFALTIMVVGSRWRSENKLLAAMALLAKLLGVVPSGPMEDKASISAVFFPLAAVMWTKWPASAAGLDDSVHPEFTGTMAKLLGMRGKELREFGRNPAIAKSFDFARYLKNGKTGFSWAIKTLLTVYSLQAVLMFVAKRQKKLKDLAERMKHAVFNALRTTLMYQVCATYSTWGFGQLGPEPPLYGAAPVAVFLVEPLSRFSAIAEYYAAHFFYCHYKDIIKTIVNSGDAAAAPLASHFDGYVQALGLPSVLLLFSAAGANPPAMSFLKAITL